MVWMGSNGIIAYSNHDVPFFKFKEHTKPFKEMTNEKIKVTAQERIDALLNKHREELYLTGWNGVGLS